MGWYALLDTMSIHKSILETNRQKIILGASLQLAAWQKDSAKVAHVWMNSAGGNVLAFFEAEDHARDFAKERVKAAAEHGFQVAWAIATGQHPEHCSPTEARDVWRSLQQQAAKYKSGARPLADYSERHLYRMPHGKHATTSMCQECGIRLSTTNEDFGGGDRRELCGVCKSRCGKWRDLRSGKSSQTPLEKLLSSFEFGEELKELAGSGEEAEPIAVLAIDFNDMGKMFQERIDIEGFIGYKTLSEKLEKEIGAVVEAAVAKTAVGTKAQCRPLLMAGDDILVALRADNWIQFIQTFFEKLHNEQRYAACAGVVIAPYNFPFNRLYTMAEELLQNAKSLSRYEMHEKPGKYEKVGCSAIDWHVFQESAFISVVEARNRAWVRRGDPDRVSVSTAKPYTFESFCKLVDAATTQWSPGAMSAGKSFSLYSALRQGEDATRNSLVFEFLRNENEKLTRYEQVWKVVHGEPWVRGFPLWKARKIQGRTLISTTIADALELSSMTASKESANG